MGRPTNLPEPWLALACVLRGAGNLYREMARLGIPERSAKRVCRGTGYVTWDEARALIALFRDNGLEP
jgi:hypothetical protein